MKLNKAQGLGWTSAPELTVSPGGGVLPIMAYKGRLRPKGVYERVGISLVEVYEGPKGRTDGIYGFIKSAKRSIFVFDSYLKGNEFTAVKRDAKFQTRYVKRG